jgi:hypothetical protein
MVESVTQTTARAPAVRPSAFQEAAGWSDDGQRKWMALLAQFAQADSQRRVLPGRIARFQIGVASTIRTVGFSEMAASVKLSSPANATDDPNTSGGVISSPSTSNASPCQTMDDTWVRAENRFQRRIFRFALSS